MLATIGVEVSSGNTRSSSRWKNGVSPARPASMLATTAAIRFLTACLSGMGIPCVFTLWFHFGHAGVGGVNLRGHRPGHRYSRFLANARPEADFKYFSNSAAF